MNTRSLMAWMKQSFFKSALSAGMLYGGAGLLGCEEIDNVSQEEGDDDLYSVSEFVNPYGGDQAPETGVVLEWQGDAYTEWSSARSGLNLKLLSNSQQPQTVVLTLVASRDNAQDERISLGSFELAGRDRAEIPIPLSQLALKATSELSAVTVEATLQRPEGQLVVTSDTLYYDRPSLGSNKLRVFPIEGMTSRLRAVDLDNADDAQLDFVETPEIEDQAQVRDLPFPKDGFPPIDFTRMVKTCVTWKAQYTDSGFGEDLDSAKGLQNIPARYTRATIVTPDWHLVWQGTLDQNGCTPFLDLSIGNYVLIRYTEVFKDGVRMRISTDVGGVQKNYELYSDFSVSLATAENSTINLYPADHHSITRTTAAAGAILNNPDHGIPAGTYYINTNIPCPGADYSCYNPNDGKVYLEEPDTYWKNIIAHEIGHNVQDRAIGTININYNTVPINTLYCDCGHVSDPAVRAHCLQSSETLSTAFVEGFAQFFAARTYNNNTLIDSNCEYAYYKEMIFPYGEFWTIYSPPVQVSCSSYRRWQDMYCSEANKGVEWDWQVFLWNLNRSSWADFSNPATSSRNRMNDIWGVFKKSCGGTSCGNKTISWSNLVSGATQYWGSSTSPKAQAWVNIGASAGVDN